MFTEDVPLATHIGKVSESLVEESPKKNILRSRLSFELLSTLRMMREQWHSVLSLYPQYYNSAMLAGDTENATICFFMCESSYGVLILLYSLKKLLRTHQSNSPYQDAAGSFWSGSICISVASRLLAMCMKEAVRFNSVLMLFLICGSLPNNCCHF